MNVCAIILSGGVSKRFEGDKALTPVDGQPMVRRVAAALHEAVGDVWLSVKNSERGEHLLNVCKPFAKGYIVDEYEAGPLGGLMTAARKIDADFYVTSSNDVPWLTASSIKKYVELMNSISPSALSVVWGNGAVETLVAAVKRDLVVYYTEKIFNHRQNLYRPSDILRTAEPLYLIHASNITDDPYEFSNINTFKDLENRKPRGPFSGLVKNDLLLKDPARYFQHGVEMSKTGQYHDAGFQYFDEAALYMLHGVVHLARHALNDAAHFFESAGSSEASNLARGLEQLLAVFMRS